MQVGSSLQNGCILDYCQHNAICLHILASRHFYICLRTRRSIFALTGKKDDKKWRDKIVKTLDIAAGWMSNRPYVQNALENLQTPYVFQAACRSLARSPPLGPFFAGKAAPAGTCLIGKNFHVYQ